MARIRTIKPEFPESESVGRLSRDARLLFILLWTFVDDFGRARASSRLLASRLYPYDHDAPEQIDDWLTELEREGHIRRYVVDGSRYLDVPKWLEHQKIDHKTKSRIPECHEEFATVSEDFAKTSDEFATHTLDHGPVPRTMDQGEGAQARSLTLEPDAEEPATDDTKPKRGHRLPDDWQPSQALDDFARDLGLDPASVWPKFIDHWRAAAGANARKLDWNAAARNWCRGEIGQRSNRPQNVRSARDVSEAGAFYRAGVRLGGG